MGMMLDLLFLWSCLAAFSCHAIPEESSSSFLRTTTTHHEQRMLQEEESSEQQLETIFSYVPRRTVIDEAAIDLDQREIVMELDRATDEYQPSGFGNALNVYTYGAHSQSYARITLKDDIMVPVPRGAAVVGKNTAGGTVMGTLLRNVYAGSTVIEVLYETSSDVRKHVGCQVGASTNPLIEGCFAEDGTLTIGSNAPIEYEYDMLLNNRNDRTIRKFSLTSEADMYSCQTERCPYQDYLKFYNYYGRFDYADAWITSAIRGEDLTYPSNKGNANFSKFGDVGQAEAIKKGTVYLNLWMYVIGRLEHAISRCYHVCNLHPNVPCNDTSYVETWDDAVAYYVGSLQMATDGSVSISNNYGGYLLYQLAVDNCVFFNTCGEGYNGDHEAVLNRKLFDEFVAGQQHLLAGSCLQAETSKERIVSLMTIPLIQGTMLTAYVIEHNDNYSEQSEAHGATYAAAILPMIYACSPSDADIIYQRMKIGGDLTDGNSFATKFVDIKHAFERTYPCLKISCEDIGGLRDITNGYTDVYMPGGEPCTDGINRDPAGLYTKVPAPAPRTPQPPPPPEPSFTSPASSSSPHSEHHHHFYRMKELSVAAQAAVCIGLFFLMLFITLLCCFTWKVPITNDELMDYES